MGFIGKIFSGLTGRRADDKKKNRGHAQGDRRGTSSSGALQGRKTFAATGKNPQAAKAHK